MSKKRMKVEKPFSWFWKNAGSLSEDIDRHREDEKELREKIEWLERHLAVYRNSLNKLLESKAEVVSKIGRKKE